VRPAPRRIAALLLVAAAGLAAPGAAAACPISYGSTDDAKPNKLYLYYPTVADPAFPEYGGPGYETSPADPFDVSQLSSYSGSAATLRGAVNNVVKDDYCEFNVQMRATTSFPPNTFARREVVAVSTDDNSTGRWGRSDLVDTGDPTAVNYGRIWAGRYQATSGGPGGALNGVKSTTQRWANAIGGTAAHEAGHGYGLSHDTTVLSGEDAFTRHIMPAGSDVSDEQRAGYRRHFSDTDFSILASNVGLSIQTMHNWDLVNPNSTAGQRFRLTFLSPQASPILSWDYQGSLSPWINPTVSANGTQTFKGTTYNRFRLTWTTGHAWSGGASGVVPAGGGFHVGATFSGIDFNSPDPIIITKSELLDGSGTPLPLKPRLPGYDSGHINLNNGALTIDFTNFGRRRMRLRNVVVSELPRVLSIDSMVPGGRMMDPFGEPFLPWPRGTRVLLQKPRIIRARRGRLVLPVAFMRERRHILERVEGGREGLRGRGGCSVGDSQEEGVSDAPVCLAGFNASLFPATTLLITADAVAPRSKVWSPRRKRFVRRSLTSRIYYQIGGRRPDLNGNGVDDAIDVAFGRSPDRNGDGVPDEAQLPRLTIPKQNLGGVLRRGLIVNVWSDRPARAAAKIRLAKRLGRRLKQKGVVGEAGIAVPSVGRPVAMQIRLSKLSRRARTELRSAKTAKFLLTVRLNGHKGTLKRTVTLRRG
jgi:hypothetical protein